MRIDIDYKNGIWYLGCPILLDRPVECVVLADGLRKLRAKIDVCIGIAFDNLVTQVELLKNKNADEVTESFKRLSIKQRILDYLAFKGTDGATVDEVEHALSISHQSCSPRFTELKHEHLIKTYGVRRKTYKGVLADVHVLTQYAPTLGCV
jgi:hypothetical protein